MNRTVRLEKRIKGEDLENIMIAAGKELGLKAKVKDHYSAGNRLGCVKQERAYERTDILLSKCGLPRMEVTFWKQMKPRPEYGPDLTSFAIHTRSDSGYFYLFATEKKVEKYLSAVSKLVEQYNPAK